MHEDEVTDGKLGEYIQDAIAIRSVSRRSLMKAGVGTVAIGGFGALLAACSGSSSTSTGSSKSGSTGAIPTTLTVVSALGATNFDPEQPAGTFLFPLFYDSLFDTSLPADIEAAKKLLADFEPAPALATSWTPSADGLTWDLTLNTKAMSPFGNAFSAADVLWSFERNLALKWYGGIFLNRIGVTDIKQVTSSAPDKITIKLNGPVGKSYFLQLLGNFIVPIFDSTEAKKHVTTADPWASTWISKNACGFGPYTIKSVSPDGSLNVYEANPNYYGDKPIQTITWRETTETSAQLELLLRGEAQMSDSLSPLQSETVAKNSTTKITTVASTGAVFIGFNSSEDIYKDVAFRQGLAYAIPFDEVVNGVYKGQATTIKAPLSSFIQGYTPEFWNYTLDIGKAKSLLAPYAGKSITLQYKGGDTTLQTLAVLIQSSLAAAGLHIQLAATDPTTFQSKLTAATLSMWIDTQSTPLVADPLYGLQLLFPTKPTQVLLHYSNPTLDAIIDKLATTFDTATQNTYIKQALKILVEELPILPLAQIPGIIPSAKDLTNFRGHGSNFTWAKDLKYV